MPLDALRLTPCLLYLLLRGPMYMADALERQRMYVVRAVPPDWWHTIRLWLYLLLAIAGIVTCAFLVSWRGGFNAPESTVENWVNSNPKKQWIVPTENMSTPVYPVCSSQVLPDRNISILDLALLAELAYGNRTYNVQQE